VLGSCLLVFQVEVERVDEKKGEGDDIFSADKGELLKECKGAQVYRELYDEGYIYCSIYHLDLGTLVEKSGSSSALIKGVCNQTSDAPGTFETPSDAVRGALLVVSWLKGICSRIGASRRGPPKTG
jgi:hypothetical protein